MGYPGLDPGLTQRCRHEDVGLRCANPTCACHPAQSAASARLQRKERILASFYALEAIIPASPQAGMSSQLANHSTSNHQKRQVTPPLNPLSTACCASCPV